MPVGNRAEPRLRGSAEDWAPEPLHHEFPGGIAGTTFPQDLAIGSGVGWVGAGGGFVCLLHAKY